MFTTINEFAQYEDFDTFAYTCIERLIVYDEMVWKLLKYNTPDAWSKPDLSKEEKIAMIYRGEDDTSRFRVFMDSGQPDVITSETTEIRISPYSIKSLDRLTGNIMIMFEVYAHYKINHLSNYRTRTDMIMKRFIQVFNGAIVGGLGKLALDGIGVYGSRLETGGQLPFRGKWLLMGNKSV
jgi:hypothetical protein